MPSERIQIRIGALLDAADEAATRNDWETVRARADAALAFDPENVDAKAYLEAASRRLPNTDLASSAEAKLPSSMPAAGPAIAQPTAFANGRYTVKRFLGEGGKKKVYLAHDSLLDRDVAFAMIKTEGLDAASRERVTREAQAMGRLGAHPHIVTVFDIGEENEQPYLVLPVLAGGDVEGVIEKAPEHKLPLEQALKIAIETCLGLEFVHGKGIIHRDLKPGNVWLTEDGRAMIGDFGLAVAMDRSRLTQAGMMVGTVSYMPPEQAMGGEITPRSDLYALGAMIYEMVCGRPPFVGDESVAIIGQHLNTPPVAPTWHRPDCPAALEALILRLLEKDPNRRPESAREVREALTLTLSRGERGQDHLLAGRDRDRSSSLLPAGEGGRRPDEGVPAASPDPLYRRTFVGRENEVRQLQQTFDGAMSGNGGLVMVVGEPGIGKTAICEQLATYVALRGGKALVGHCYEEGSLSLPYLAFVEAMRSYVLAREPDGLRSDLGTGAADVARIVSEVRDRVQGVELRPAGDPEDDRWRLLQSITSFLRNASTVQPLCIVLEDLHWADRGSLDLLLHVSRNLQGARLLIVGTYRDVEVDRSHPLSSVLADLRRNNDFLRVPLRGLTVDEVHRMYESIRGNEVPWGQAEAVHRATEGNPLFVQEVLRYLVEEGIVVREEGRYVAQGGVGVGIPEGLRDVVGKRLNRLKDGTNQVLTLAAVIGRDFTLEVLQKVSPLSEDDLFSALEEAQERAIIEQVDAAGRLGFRFTHAFFRQTLYEEMFSPRRIRQHQVVGRALEELYKRRLEDHAPELAEHFAQSTETDDLRKAVHYSELAAARALSVFSYGEAVRHWGRALRAQEVLDPDDESKRCEILLATTEALGPAGEAQKAVDVAEEAFHIAAKLADRARASRACRAGLYGLFRIGGDIASNPARLTWAERADHYAAEQTIERVEADIALAQIAMSNFDRVEGVRLSHQAYELAKRLGERQAVFRSGIQILNTSSLDLRYQTAVDLTTGSRQGVAIFTLSGALIVSIPVFLQHGERARAERLLDELREHGQRTREGLAQISSIHQSATFAFLDGKFDEVLAAMDKHRALSLELGISTDTDNRTAMMAQRTLWHLGMPARPDRDPMGEQLNQWFPTGENHALDAFLRNGPFSRQLGRIAFSMLPDGPAVTASDVVSQQMRLNLVEAAVLTHQPRLLPPLIEAVRLIGELSIGSFLNHGNFGNPARVLGTAKALLDEPAAARTYFELALDTCGKINFRPEIALTRLDLAELLLEHYPDERAAAIEHLDFAIAELRDMRMQPALERALRHRGLLKA